MRIIKCYLDIGYPGAMHKDELEVDDDATVEDIDQEVADWANNYIDYGWTEGEE